MDCSLKQIKDLDRFLDHPQNLMDSSLAQDIKVKVQVYSLISNLKTHHATLHLTHSSLDLFIRVPFQLHGEHTVLQPSRRIKLIVHHTLPSLSYQVLIFT